MKVNGLYDITTQQLTLYQVVFNCTLTNVLAHDSGNVIVVNYD